MNLGEWVQIVLFGFVIILTILFLTTTTFLPSLLTTPVSDSMEPTISEGEVVLLNPFTEPKDGDVVVFQTPEVEEQVLHRIVGVEETGFITQGDGNEITDQEAGIEPIPEENIEGVVATWNGEPIIIPFLGLFIQNPFYLIALWFIISVYTFIEGLFTKDYDSVSEELKENRVPIFIVIVIIFFLLPAITIGTSTVQEVSILTSSNPTDDPSVVGTNEQGQETVEVDTFLTFMTSITTHSDSDEVFIDSVERTDDNFNVTVMNEPRDSIGTSSGIVEIYTYPRVLPQPFLDELAAIHPIVASVVCSIVISLAFIIPSLFFLDPKKPYRYDKKVIREQLRRKR